LAALPAFFPTNPGPFRVRFQRRPCQAENGGASLDDAGRDEGVSLHKNRKGQPERTPRRWIMLCVSLADSDPASAG